MMFSIVSIASRFRVPFVIARRSFNCSPYILNNKTYFNDLHKSNTKHSIGLKERGTFDPIPRDGLAHKNGDGDTHFHNSFGSMLRDSSLSQVDVNYVSSEGKGAPVEGVVQEVTRSVEDPTKSYLCVDFGGKFPGYITVEANSPSARIGQHVTVLLQQFEDVKSFFFDPRPTSLLESEIVAGKALRKMPTTSASRSGSRGNRY